MNICSGIPIENEIRLKKPIITIYADERGVLHENKADFSFGDSSYSEKTGYTMMCHGKIFQIGFTTDAESSYKIHVTVNGHKRTAIAGNSKTTSKQVNIPVNKHDVISFSNEIQSRARSSIICLLIELDL